MNHSSGRVVAVLAVLALTVAACGGRGAPKNATVRVGPPVQVAVITMIGAGSSAGVGTTAVLVDLAPGRAFAHRTVDVGQFPDAVAVSPDGKTAYVTSYTGGLLTPIDLLTGTSKPGIAVGSGPAGVAITPNGRRAYVTDAGTSPIGSTVVPVDLRTRKALTPITVGEGPQGIAITPDGKTAYVADAGAIVTGQVGSIGHTVTPIDLATDQALAPIDVGNAPLAIAISDDGSTAFVANSYSGSVSPIAVSTNGAGTPIEVSGSPQAIAIGPKEAFVTDASSSSSAGDNLTPISVASETAGAALTVPKNPTGIAVSADGKTAWIVLFDTDSLVEVDLATNKVVAVDKAGLAAGPYAIAIASVPASAAAKVFPPPTTSTAKDKTT